MPIHHPAHHAVFRLREQRLARSAKPFLARGSRALRCIHCRIPATHCLCDLHPHTSAQAGVCLLMSDIEPLKPTNTGWLIADVLPENTFAFMWARTVVDSDLLELLNDPQWQPYVVFPAEFVAPERVVTQLPVSTDDTTATTITTKRPLFVLLDATWSEARKMFRKSPYLNRLPVLSLQSEQLSRYRLRRSKRDDHYCTAEVAALCLELAGESHAAQTLDAWFDVFSAHYLAAKRLIPVDRGDMAHQHLQNLQNLHHLPNG